MVCIEVFGECSFSLTCISDNAAVSRCLAWGWRPVNSKLGNIVVEIRFSLVRGGNCTKLLILEMLSGFVTLISDSDSVVWVNDMPSSGISTISNSVSSNDKSSAAEIFSAITLDGWETFGGILLNSSSSILGAISSDSSVAEILRLLLRRLRRPFDFWVVHDEGIGARFSGS